MKRTNLVLLFLVANFILSLADEEYDYSNGPRGQANWGNLREEWRVCGNGTVQSPIDIQSEDLQPVCSLKLLQTRYKPMNATLTNLDHDIALEFNHESPGTLTIDGTVYEVSEYHIHAPSEHTINGRHFAVEGHLVHTSRDNRIAVVGVMYTVGSEDDPFIDQVEHFLPELSGEQDVHVVDPSLLNVGGKRFFRYVGSLTSPPCTEQVTWSVLRRPRTISKKQYELLIRALNGTNNRLPQGLFGRNVQYYK